MKMTDIKAKAKKMGIKAGKLRKADLIRTIQATEENTPCYQSEDATNCPQTNCCWRDDCF